MCRGCTLTLLTSLGQSSDHLEEGRCCVAQAATAPRATSLVLRSGRLHLRRTDSVWWPSFWRIKPANAHG